MTSLKFRPMTEKEFEARFDGESVTLEEWNDMGREQHEKNLAEAQGVMLGYVQELIQTGSDRDAVQQVRDRMRMDMGFLTHSRFIALLSQEKMDWVHSVIRSEARRGERSAGESLERMRAEREAQRLKELAEEKAEVENLPNYGMF